MIRRAYLVVCAKGPAVFLEASKAYTYAADHHGYVVKMYGEDHGLQDVEVKEEKEKVDHLPALLDEGCT